MRNAHQTRPGTSRGTVIELDGTIDQDQIVINGSQIGPLRCDGTRGIPVRAGLQQCGGFQAKSFEIRAGR